MGCVLVDARNRILSTGYNGVASGRTHCVDVACPGANLKSGMGLDSCEAIHAEINALIHCRDIYSVHKAYLTTTPCISCIKALLASSCQEIIASSEYPHKEAQNLWVHSGRSWKVIDTELSPSNGQQRIARAIFAV